MRSPRFVVAVAVLGLTASVASVAPSASARVDTAGERAVVAATKIDGAGTSVRAEPITITSRVVKKKLRPNRPEQLVLVGSVNPPKGPVWIQKATTCNKKKTEATDRLVCNFKFYRKVYLKKGRYQAVVGAPPALRGWVWRAKVKTSYGEPWLTCTRRDKQKCKIPF